MSSSQEFRRAIEEIKARTSLEDVVGECVDGDLVQRSGRLWACCPFHDESTPSFAIGPDPGLWYCFGACRMGGDLIEFVKRRNNLSFLDAIELLAARCGVTLPERQKGERHKGADEGLAVLARAASFYCSELEGARGAQARAYLEERELSAQTIADFAIGVAPSSGQGLVDLARRSGGGPEPWERTGLVRVADGGRRYDFFRGRLMIPIRDHRGRTVGFGGRRLEDGERAGPKYVNTPETDWFKKGSVIYGYDRAVDSIRRAGHAILMEGYTDVLAAHQAGITQACAVLGTATTSMHADLLRRAGVRRVSLIFDGDEAGRRAAWRAMEGLLPLDVELDVVRPPAGQDPADLLAGGDAQPFLAHLEQAQPWFDFVAGTLVGLSSRDLSRAVDDVLELLSAVPKPVHRDALLADLAGRLSLPAETLREQWRALPERRRARAERQVRPPAGSQPEEASATAAGEGPSNAPQPPPRPLAPAIKNAYMEAIGAALVDTSLIPRVQPLQPVCPHPGLGEILGALCRLWDDEDADLTVDAVLTELGDHPVRGNVAWLVQHVHNAESPLSLLEGALEVLRKDAYQKRLQAAKDLVAELEREQAASGVALLDPDSQSALPGPTRGPQSFETAQNRGDSAPFQDGGSDSYHSEEGSPTWSSASQTPSDPSPEHSDSGPPNPGGAPPEPPPIAAPHGASAADLSGPPQAAGRPTLAEALEALTQLLREGPGTQFPLPPSVGGAA